MKLTMCKKICNQCPFSKNSMRGWLGPHSIEEILHVQQMEGLFSCHMTREDETTVEDIKEGRTPICRGFIASASASCKLFGQNPETGNALRELQDQITPEEKKEVLPRWEFKNHHELELDI